MPETGKLFLKSDLKAYLWLGAFSLMAIPAKAADISLVQYALIFALLCLVLFLGTTVARLFERPRSLRDAVRLLTLVVVLALLFFPMRSPGTPLWMFALLFVGLYVVLLAAFFVYQRFSR